MLANLLSSFVPLFLLVTPFGADANRSPVHPVGQGDHLVAILASEDMSSYDRQIETTFGEYIEKQQNCVHGLAYVIELLEDKDNSLEHLTKQKRRDILDDLFKGKLVVLQALDKTTSMRDKWQDLRKYPMYEDFLKFGHTKKIKEAISSMVKTGSYLLSDVDSSIKYIQRAGELLPSDAPQSVLGQIWQHLKNFVDKLSTTGDKSFTSQVIYVAVILSFCAMATKLISVFMDKLPWRLLALLTLAIPAFLAYTPPREEFALGKVDNLAITIIRDIRPFTKTDWRKLPMTDGSWAKKVEVHMHMDQLGETFEVIVKNQQNSLQTFRLSVWFENKMGNVQKASWIVRQDYSHLASSMRDVETSHSKLQKKIVTHILKRKEFVLGLIVNVFQATDIESLLNYLEICFDMDEELSREHEELVQALPETGERLKSLLNDIDREQRSHDKGKARSVVVVAGSVAVGVLAVSTMGLAAAILGTAVAAGGGVMFGEKYLEHKEHAEILRQLENLAEQCERLVRAQSEQFQPLSTNELRESFKSLRKILSQHLPKTPLDLDMRYYFGDPERTAKKYVKTLDEALEGFQDLARKSDRLTSGDDDE